MSNVIVIQCRSTTSSFETKCQLAAEFVIKFLAHLQTSITLITEYTLFVEFGSLYGYCSEIYWDTIIGNINNVSPLVNEVTNMGGMRQIDGANTFQ